MTPKATLFGGQTWLVQPTEDEIMKQAANALQAGAPPDVLFSTVEDVATARWAYEDRLVDLKDVGAFVADGDVELVLSEVGGHKIGGLQVRVNENSALQCAR